jgi:hypothetical protein
VVYFAYFALLEGLKTPLADLCTERRKKLKAIFLQQHRRVRDLVGYTKSELMAFVERKGGPDGQVPSFLEQTLANGRTLASYLKGADRGNCCS